ncbi:tetratricopeptide repeat protein [Microcystis aeruginosa CS-555/01A07]|uniref:tetratricopeptide repeat protein n=1 Tax=Microcystis aeruginosa TaxID=1126 RepID=UPI00232E8E5F|nr:tetratricopeptide repeat protein [Microcystis aeruginosa]MDB9428556.1 tetratricopeptide repeat protein [Microcystis aeruginosa CS-555/01A07]
MNDFQSPQLRVKERLTSIDFTVFGELAQVKQKGEILGATGSHFEKAHFGAFIWHLIGYERHIKDKMGQQLSIQERASRYVEAFLCLCRLGWYKEAKSLFSLPLEIHDPTSLPLHKQLRIWGRYEDGIKLCKELLGNLDNETDFLCLSELGYMYRELGQFDQAKNYAEKLLSLAEQLNNPLWKARGKVNIATIDGIQGEYLSAEIGLNEVLNLAEIIPDCDEKFEIINVAYLNLGNCYGYQGKVDQTIACLEKYLKWAEKIKNLIYQAMALRNLGEAHRRINDLNQAIDYTQISLNLSEQITDEAGIILSLGNLASIYGQQANFQESEKYFKQQKKKALAISDVASVAHACAGLGEIYSITRKDDLAYQYLNQALDIALDIGEQYIELETLIVLAEFEEKTHDLKSAINHWQRALHLSEKLNMLSHKENCEQNLERLLNPN